MGNIEFIGVIDDNFTLGEIDVPDNANILTGVDNLNPINWLIFTLQIILILAVILIIKQKKYGILNKECRKKMQEENIEKYKLNTMGKKVLFGLKTFIKLYITYMIFFFVIMIIHEFLHALVGAICGGNMRVGIMYPGAVTVTDTALTKFQYLIILLTPMITLGILPAIIILLSYPKKIKKHFVVWFITFLCIGTILSAAPDLISTYNICKQVPNGAIMQETDEYIYWYNNEDSREEN